MAVVQKGERGMEKEEAVKKSSRRRNGQISDDLVLWVMGAVVVGLIGMVVVVKWAMGV